jgi:hypothetical protein
VTVASPERLAFPPRHAARQLRALTPLPPNYVGRSSHVSGEEDAIKVDALVSETKAMFESEKVPGYSGIVRTVCKAEWGAQPASAPRRAISDKAS